jgi:hypothetical protein
VLACALAIAAVADAATQRTITRSQAPAIAAAISLRHSDLPKLEQQSNPITKQEQQQNAELTACIGGVPNSEALVETQSPTFAATGGSSLTVSSDTEILPSAALVAKDLAATVGPKGVPCFESQLRAELAGSVAKGQTLSIKTARLPPPVSGSDGTFGLRFTISVVAKQGSVAVKNAPVYADLIGFAYGQAEVGLNVVSSGTKPSTALERQLTATLLKRARTAIG